MTSCLEPLENSKPYEYFNHRGSNWTKFWIPFNLFSSCFSSDPLLKIKHVPFEAQTKDLNSNKIKKIKNNNNHIQNHNQGLCFLLR